MMPWQQSLRLYLAYRTARHHSDLPADPAAVEQAQGLCRTTTGGQLPGEIVSLWQTVAGVDFNGTLIFPPVEIHEPDFVPGLVETNRDLPEPPYLHIGSFGDEHISWDGADGSYVKIDKISSQVLPAFDSFDDLLEEHFGRYLVTWAERRAPELLEGR